MSDIKSYWVPQGTLSDQSGWHPDDNEVVLACHYDALKAELAGLRTGYEAQNEVIAGMKAQDEALRASLKEMCAMYTHVWDREDGSLVCFSSNVERFDKAHEAAWAILTGQEASHD